jgi:branched-chain amino acid transport system substrate-binding protein
MTRFPSAVVIAALALVACGGTATPAAAPPSASRAASPSQAAVSASAKPSQAAASPSASEVAAKPSAAASAAQASAEAGATAQPIKIGLIEPFTGPFAEIAKDNRDGMNMFLESVNGVIAGRKVEAITADDQTQGDVGLTKAKQLVESDKVQILMGTVATPVCYAVSGYVKQAQVPYMVTGYCTAQNLTVDPKFASPYLTRVTLIGMQMADPAAEWAYKQGFRKAVLISSDFAAGLENGDATAAAFIKRGGTIVQELYPKLGTNDFGPIVSQIDKSADVLLSFVPGTDGIRYVDAYTSYLGANKPPIVDVTGGIIVTSNIDSLKDKALGIVASKAYVETLDNPKNKAFVKAYQQKFPGKMVSVDVALTYSAFEIFEAALKKVNGAIEQKQAFLDALQATNLETARGQIKLDKYHDIVQNIYMYKIVKQGASYGTEIVDTNKEVSQFATFTPEQMAKLQVGTMKGKWVGMTKAKLDEILK